MFDEDSFRNEEMGTREKFWFTSNAESNEMWLFKYPRKNSGEHWAEKIAEQICLLLDIKHARVKLAKYSDTYATASKNFVEYRELFHGNHILSRVVTDYDPDKKFKQSKHTLDNIFLALERAFGSIPLIRPYGDLEIFPAKCQIAEYFVLDALIGNTDRHHENWGVLLDFEEDTSNLIVRLAPTYDHASSLGRELVDTNRQKKMDGERIENYSRKARGAVYWSECERRGPAPFDLVRLANQKYPEIFQPALNKLAELDSYQLRSVVDRIPRSWMTDPARNFATEIMSYNLNSLKKLIQ